MARARPHGDGEEASGPPSSRRGRPHTGGDESVAAAHETISAEAQLGRPGGSAGRGSSPGTDEESITLGSTSSEAGSAQSFVDNITSDPRSVAGRSAQDIADQFNAAGYPATVEQSQKKGTSGNAVQVRIQGHPEITNIQVHPGGGRHTPEGSPYWKISTSTAGKTWVIPEDFRGADELGGNVVRYEQ